MAKDPTEAPGNLTQSGMAPVIVEINGKDFTIAPLPVAEARQVYAKVQRVLVLSAEESVEASGVGATMWATMAGGLPEEDLDVVIKLCATRTTVDFRDGRVMPLTSAVAMNAAFEGAIDDMFSWLDECFKVNFEGVLAKMRAAATKAHAAAEAKKAHG